MTNEQISNLASMSSTMFLELTQQIEKDKCLDLGITQAGANIGAIPDKPIFIITSRKHTPKHPFKHNFMNVADCRCKS